MFRRDASRHRRTRAALFAAPAFLAAATLGGFYLHFARITDNQLRAGAFGNSIDLYAAPVVLSEGDAFTADELSYILQQAGYSPSETGAAGTYQIAGSYVQIAARNQSTQARVRLVLGNKKIAALDVNGARAASWTAGAPLVANLTSTRDENGNGSADREKRRIVTFKEIPPVLVQAVTDIEDKHFFEHHGVDVPRLAKALWVDFTQRRKGQGGSTLTMQLVRGLWLQPEKRWARKAAEIMMTLRLESKWSKQQIFETYANQVFLGRQAAYGVHGFSEGARMFFSKPLRDVTLPEAALLAGLVQRPSYFNPYRHPDRAKERRDLVLAMMHRNGHIDNAQYEAAVATPLRLNGESERDDSFGAPYFLDLVGDEVRKRHWESSDELASSPRSIYTTLDLNLQRAASEAVTAGMAEVDNLLAKRNGKAAGKAEAALIAIDPHTGAIKAMVGGRNYAHSQLDRILASRPPGSIFKPFVYAAAMNTGVVGGEHILTPASIVDDTPVTFWFRGKAYQPGNFHQESYGMLTLRQALAKSDNIAAVKVAEQVGYDRVVALARRAGLNDEIQATPSVALGSYAVTPLEMVGAWTTFANGGTWVKPQLFSEIRKVDGKVIQRQSPETHAALDPRVAYLMTGMLQEVMRSGTAAGVRSRGFVLPAAGKTGTSHDGWFAGYTSNLLTLVWVGFDDYRELNLEGAKSALPIWTEFMKKATRFAAYRNVVEFARPTGISSANICVDSGKLASDQCIDTRAEIFINGTEPHQQCDTLDHFVEEVSFGVPPYPAPAGGGITQVAAAPALPLN